MPCLSQLQLWFWSYGLIRLLGPSGPDVVSGSQTPRSKWWLVCEVGATVMDVWLTTSSGPKWPKCSFQVPDTNVKKYFDISWFYWIQLMIFVKMKLWFWTYGLIRLLGPSGPDVISGSQTTRSKIFFAISWVDWIYLMIFEQMMAYLWKLQLRFWTYALILLLGPSGPDVVYGSQSPRSKHFLRFHNLIRFISWFFRKWWPVF